MKEKEANKCGFGHYWQHMMYYPIRLVFSNYCILTSGNSRAATSSVSVTVAQAPTKSPSGSIFNVEAYVQSKLIVRIRSTAHCSCRCFFIWNESSLISIAPTETSRARCFFAVLNFKFHPMSTRAEMKNHIHTYGLVPYAQDECRHR